MTNADGSSDIWFGPIASAEAHANWIKTAPGHGYFAGMRLRGPTEAFLDRSWKLPDIQKVK